MELYLLRHIPTQVYKIGISKSAKVRYQALGGEKNGIVLIRVYQFSYHNEALRHEKLWHRVFHHKRYPLPGTGGTEWFRLDSDDLDIFLSINNLRETSEQFELTIRHFLPKLEELRLKLKQQRTQSQIENLKYKLTLSVAEAVALSGLPRHTIKDAIASGKLQARKVGRGERVHRDDLNLFLHEFFNKDK